MKIMMAVVVMFAVMLTAPEMVQAKASGGGTHFDENPDYDCSKTKKPETPKWVAGVKKEIPGDRMVTLTWDDSKRAHDVEIRYRKAGGSWKTKKTGDDSREKIKYLSNGKFYIFKVRGVSNCGKSGWSKKYQVMP